MISETTAAFWRAFHALTSAQQQAARRAYRNFAETPGHNSLRFKKLAGHAAYWSIRVNRNLRAVAERHGDTVIWVWIGNHSEFDKLFS